MSIKIKLKEENSINPQTYEGFCHEVSLVLGINGSVTPNKIILGNKGDKEITELVFNYDALRNADFVNGDIEEFTHILAIQLPSGEVSEYTLTLGEDGKSHFTIPAEICEESGSISLIYKLDEKEEATGNISQQEVFISDMFKGTVTTTDWEDWMEEELNAINEDDDVLLYLSKPDIVIQPSEDHYTIKTSSTDLGNKRDRYMTRLTFNNSTGNLDEGLDDRYAIFFTNSTIVTISKFSSVSDDDRIMTAWVPPVVTESAGWKNLMLVARTSDKNKRWISNTLKMHVDDNFLQGVTRALFYTNDEDSLAFKVESEGDSSRYEDFIVKDNE